MENGSVVKRRPQPGLRPAPLHDLSLSMAEISRSVFLSLRLLKSLFKERKVRA